MQYVYCVPYGYLSLSTRLPIPLYFDRPEAEMHRNPLTNDLPSACLSCLPMARQNRGSAICMCEQREGRSGHAMHLQTLTVSLLQRPRRMQYVYFVPYGYLSLSARLPILLYLD